MLLKGNATNDWLKSWYFYLYYTENQWSRFTRKLYQQPKKCLLYEIRASINMKINIFLIVLINKSITTWVWWHSSAAVRFLRMLPSGNIPVSHLSPMCCNFWEKCTNGHKNWSGVQYLLKDYRDFNFWQQMVMLQNQWRLNGGKIVDETRARYLCARFVRYATNPTYARIIYTW